MRARCLAASFCAQRLLHFLALHIFDRGFGYREFRARRPACPASQWYCLRPWRRGGAAAARCDHSAKLRAALNRFFSCIRPSTCSGGLLASRRRRGVVDGCIIRNGRKGTSLRWLWVLAKAGAKWPSLRRPKCCPRRRNAPRGSARTPLAPRNDALPSTTTKASATAQTPLPRAPHETPRLPARTPLPPPPPPDVECQCCYDTVPVTQTVAMRLRGQTPHTESVAGLRAPPGPGANRRGLGDHDASRAAPAARRRSRTRPSAQALTAAVRRQRDAIVARAELMRANIEGLQSCPFCPYSCVKPALFTDATRGLPVRTPRVRQAVLHAVQGRIVPDKPHACPESEETDALTDAVIRDWPALRDALLQGRGGATRCAARRAPPSRVMFAGS